MFKCTAIKKKTNKKKQTKIEFAIEHLKQATVEARLALNELKDLQVELKEKKINQKNLTIKTILLIQEKNRKVFLKTFKTLFEG